MEVPKDRNANGLSADELLLVLAYRRCNDRRQGAVRTFASKLAGLYTTEPDAAPNVIDLLKYRR